MNVTTQQDVDVINGKFNHFHDGFFKAIRVRCDSKFLTDMPWEEQRQFSSNEEELHATGRVCDPTNPIAVELEIHHYNYDWPNQPRNRVIIVRAEAAQLAGNLVAFTGCDIFDLTFVWDVGRISCILTHHTDVVEPVQRMDNGIKTTLVSAAKMEIQETVWAEEKR